MPQPKLTVILFSASDYAAIELTIAFLLRQTVVDQIELLLFAPQPLTVPDDVAHAFGRCQTYVADVIWDARVLGAHAATTPIIAYAEDHAFPAANWAEVLLEAHAQWDAVAPMLVNATHSVLSVADCLLNFAAYLAPVHSQQMTRLVGHNTSYKRDHLLQFDTDLRAYLASESVFHTELQRRGYRLFLTAETYVTHINISRLGTFMAHKYDGARLFGGIRSRNWSIWRRGVYVLAAPLVFAMRFRHVLRRFPDLGVVVAVKTAPLTTVGAMIATAGELLGYILGAGRSTIRYPAYESNRINQISDADRHIVELLSADVY